MKKVLGFIVATLIMASAAHAQAEVTLPTEADLPKGCLDAALSSLADEDVTQGYFTRSVTDGSRATKRIVAAYDAWFELGKNPADLLQHVMQNSSDFLEQAAELYYKTGEDLESLIPRFYPDLSSVDKVQAKLTIYCQVESCDGFKNCVSGRVNSSGTEFSEKMTNQVSFFSQAVELARKAGVSEQRINKDMAAFKRLQKKALKAARKAPARSHTIVYRSN